MVFIGDGTCNNLANFEYSFLIFHFILEIFGDLSEVSLICQLRYWKNCNHIVIIILFAEISEERDKSIKSMDSFNVITNKFIPNVLVDFVDDFIVQNMAI